jgi:hypothetical protein
MQIYVDIVITNVKNAANLCRYRNYQRLKRCKFIYIDIVITNIQNDANLCRYCNYQRLKRCKFMSIS